jgi:hypothetical protein
MANASHLALVVHDHAPLFRTIDDVAFETCITHIPQRRREPVADELSILLVSRFAPDEGVSEPQRILRRRSGRGVALPVGRQLDAARGERRVGRGFGLGAPDLQRRGIGFVGAGNSDRNETEDPEHR